MKSHNLRYIFLAVLGVSVCVSQSQGQTLLYDNGPINVTNSSRTINGGFSIADSFTLSANSIVSNATVGIFNTNGDSLSSVQWRITTAPFGGTTLASGTAATTDTFLQNSAFYPGWSIYSDNISITPTELTAGTYWFQLGNAVTFENQGTGWTYNSGPSSAYQDLSGYSAQSISSESFQLYGTITSAPEPSAVAMALIGGLSLACLRRRPCPRSFK